MDILSEIRKSALSVREILLDENLLSLIREQRREEAMRNASQIRAFVFSYESGEKEYSGFLVIPKNEQQEKFPVIVFNRGGTGEFGSIKRGQFFLGSIASFVRDGYAVIGSQCMGFSENAENKNIGKDEMGGEDFRSVLDLKNIIEQCAFLDADCVGVFGASRGGMTTYRLLIEPDWLTIGAAVVVSGLVDFRGNSEFRPEMMAHFRNVFGGSDEEMRKRSAILWPEKIPKNVPLLLLAGSADWRVDPRSILRFSELLINEGVPHRTVLFEGNDHYLSECSEEAEAMISNWFRRFLKEKESLPRVEKHGV